MAKKSADKTARRGCGRSRVLILIIWILLVGLLAVGVYRVWFLHFSSAPMTFDPRLWQNGVGRYRMVDDLIEHHTLEGLTREEVTVLLGEGRTHEPWAEYAEKGYSVRYDTRALDYYPYAVFVVIYNWDDLCIGCSTDPTCPY